MLKPLIYGAIIALFVIQTANVPPVSATPHTQAQAHAQVNAQVDTQVNAH